jgi:hypothetical protein
MSFRPAAASNDALASLVAAENCASAVSKALLAGDPAHIEATSRELQQAAIALAGLFQGPRSQRVTDPAFRQRLGRVLASLGMQREALLRRSAVVERSLHSIVPATRASTYAGSARSYGHNAKQSGAFKLLSA